METEGNIISLLMLAGAGGMMLGIIMGAMVGRKGGSEAPVGEPLEEEGTGREEGLGEEAEPEEQEPATVEAVLPYSESRMVILATGVNAELADGTGITGPRLCGGKRAVPPDSTLVTFTAAGSGEEETRLAAWHMDSTGKMRKAHPGDKDAAQMRHWLQGWLELTAEGRLEALHGIALREYGDAENAAEMEPDWDKAASIQGTANRLKGEAETLGERLQEERGRGREQEG